MVFRLRDYEDEAAANPAIDELRSKMVVVEDRRYTEEYLDPEKRSIANAVQVGFKDGTSTEKIEVEYPIGHRRRRSEAVPLLETKFESNLRTRFADDRTTQVIEAISDTERLLAMPINEFVDLLLPD